MNVASRWASKQSSLFCKVIVWYRHNHGHFVTSIYVREKTNIAYFMNVTPSDNMLEPLNINRADDNSEWELDNASIDIDVAKFMCDIKLKQYGYLLMENEVDRLNKSIQETALSEKRASKEEEISVFGPLGFMPIVS